MDDKPRKLPPIKLVKITPPEIPPIPKPAPEAGKPIPQSANPQRFSDDFTVEAEFRGETLWYIEKDRRISVDWTWTDGYKIYFDSLRNWKYSDGRSVPASDEERAEICHRLIKYAREKQGVAMLLMK